MAADQGERGAVWLGQLVADTTVEYLLQARLELRAKAAEYYELADRIRDKLAGYGIEIKDRKNGSTTWRVKRSGA